MAQRDIIQLFYDTYKTDPTKTWTQCEVGERLQLHQEVVKKQMGSLLSFGLIEYDCQHVFDEKFMFQRRKTIYKISQHAISIMQRMEGEKKDE